MRKMAVCPLCGGKMWPHKTTCRKCFLKSQGPNGDQTSELKRFFSKVKQDGECWIWLGSVNNKGYGWFHIKRNGIWGKILAHRYSYELVKGAISDDLELDHLCRNSLCVNPSHLEAVTHKLNEQRGNLSKVSGARALKITSCIHGHPYNEENTYRWHGHRNCRTCMRERSIKYKLKKEEVKPMDKRIFSYDGRAWDDPDPTLTPEEVKQQMSSFFPELSSATITEHKKDDGTIIYEMTRKTGTKGNKTPWKMPDWMEKYRSYFRDTGGNSIEELMNDTSTIEINAPLAILACSAHAQVMFLAALKLNHFLAQDP